MDLTSGAQKAKSIKWKNISAKEAQKREALRNKKKEQLMREIELGALNTKRYRILWHELLMRAALTEMSGRLKIACATFNRSLDVKDYSISVLMDALQAAEYQCQRSQKSNVEIIDRLINMYQTRVADERGGFQQKIEALFSETKMELGEIRKTYNQDEGFLVKVTSDAKQQREELLNDTRSIALSKIDSFADDMKNERRVAATQLEKRLESLWKDMQQVLFNYRDGIKNRYDVYEALQSKDNADRLLIKEQSNRIAVLTKEIQRFQEKTAVYERSVSKDTHELTEECNFFQGACQTAKRRYFSQQLRDKKQLSTMACEYNRCIKRLKQLVAKCERILLFLEACRKYETEDEKILPFIASSISMEKSVSKDVSFIPVRDHIWQAFKNLEVLTGFWQRLGVAKMLTSEIRSERNKLMWDANHLCGSLKCYFSQNNTNSV